MDNELILLGVFLLAGLALSFLVAAVERHPQRLYKTTCPYCQETWTGQDIYDVLEKALTHNRWWHR